MKIKCCAGLAMGLMIFLNPLTVSASGTSSPAEALFVHDAEDGPVLVRKEGMVTNNIERVPIDASVVWSRYLTDAIYLTTSNTMNAYVFAGTYLNPPEEAALFAPTGGGTPEWTYPGTKFYTDAGDNAFMLAAADADSLGITVLKWTGPGTGTPDWTARFASYVLSSYGTIAVSEDGSTIAIIAAPSGTDAHLLLFDADSSTPLVDYVASGLGFPRYVKINADGRYTAFIALATIVVYDRDLLSVRSQIAMGFSNSALDISGDGDLIAYGWPTLRVLQWNGSAYQELWTWSPGGHYVSRIAISNDGSTIVSCWYTTSHNSLKVAVHNVSSSTPLWTYDYPTSSGVYQESAGDVDITNDGKYFIIGSWGDADNINPEVHIFQRDTVPHVYYTVDMPGSMFSADISNDGSYATACGKHVHGNQMGRGGDIILISTDVVGSSEVKPGDLPSRYGLLGCTPNPFSQETVIKYQIPDDSKDFGLQIYDAGGRLVRDLSYTLSHARCPVHTSWDGRDDLNRQLPTGVYVVQLRCAGHVETEKLILMR